jgi:hypothetical protein
VRVVSFAPWTDAAVRFKLLLGSPNDRYSYNTIRLYISGPRWVYILLSAQPCFRRFIYSHSTIRWLFDIFVSLFYFYLNKSLSFSKMYNTGILTFFAFIAVLYDDPLFNYPPTITAVERGFFYSCSMTYYITTYNLSSRLNNSIAVHFIQSIYVRIGRINKRLFFENETWYWILCLTKKKLLKIKKCFPPFWLTYIFIHFF